VRDFGGRHGRKAAGIPEQGGGHEQGISRSRYLRLRQDWLAKSEFPKS
jgi:hypothetical protein